MHDASGISDRPFDRFIGLCGFSTATAHNFLIFSSPQTNRSVEKIADGANFLVLQVAILVHACCW
jgi:hypothetical protein